MDEIELLARMWITCDPNRMAYSADELAPLNIEGVDTMHPRWMWFIPRAEASLAMFKKHGFAISKIEPAADQKGR